MLLTFSKDLSTQLASEFRARTATAQRRVFLNRSCRKGSNATFHSSASLSSKLWHFAGWFVRAKPLPGMSLSLDLWGEGGRHQGVGGPR